MRRVPEKHGCSITCLQSESDPSRSSRLEIYVSVDCRHVFRAEAPRKQLRLSPRSRILFTADGRIGPGVPRKSLRPSPRVGTIPVWTVGQGSRMTYFHSLRSFVTTVHFSGFRVSGPGNLWSRVLVSLPDLRHGSSPFRPPPGDPRTLFSPFERSSSVRRGTGRHFGHPPGLVRD